MTRIKSCLQCTRPMSANDQHRKCQSCRPTPQRSWAQCVTKGQRDEYNARRRHRRAMLRDRELLRTWDEQVRARQ